MGISAINEHHICNQHINLRINKFMHDLGGGLINIYRYKYAIFEIGTTNNIIVLNIFNIHLLTFMENNIY